MTVAAPIRTVHHLAGSGGTVMSKALAAQPRTVLLSEIGPFVGQIRFNPFDPVQQFIRNYLSRNDQLLPGTHRGQFARRVLAHRIELIKDITDRHGHALIIRDHAHSDFMKPEPSRKSSLLLVLAEAGIKVLPILTIRDPVDSWLSSKANDWLKGTKSFDDYCGRLIILANLFPRKHVFRYEDFVDDPVNVTCGMCKALQIEFDPGFLARIGDTVLTGDSGRSSAEIAPRSRRPLPDEFKHEILSSASYAEIGNRFGYRLALA